MSEASTAATVNEPVNDLTEDFVHVPSPQEESLSPLGMILNHLMGRGMPQPEAMDLASAVLHHRGMFERMQEEYARMAQLGTMNRVQIRAAMLLQCNQNEIGFVKSFCLYMETTADDIPLPIPPPPP